MTDIHYPHFAYIKTAIEIGVGLNSITWYNIPRIFLGRDIYV